MGIDSLGGSVLELFFADPIVDDSTLHVIADGDSSEGEQGWCDVEYGGNTGRAVASGSANLSLAGSLKAGPAAISTPGGPSWCSPEFTFRGGSSAGNLFSMPVARIP